jgi:hypothetical protein
MDASKHVHRKPQNVGEQDADGKTRYEVAFGDERRVTLDNTPHITAAEQARLYATWSKDDPRLINGYQDPREAIRTYRASRLSHGRQH